MKKTKFMLSLILIMFIYSHIVNATGIPVTIPSVSPSQPNINANAILGVVQWIGYIIGIGMFMWVGIKYLLSGAGEKAKAKETLIPLLIGAIMVTSGTAITAAVFTAFGYNS